MHLLAPKQPVDAAPNNIVRWRYEDKMDVEEIVAKANCSRTTVYKIWKVHADDNGQNSNTDGRGRSRLLDPYDVRHIEQLVQQKKTIYLKEIRTSLVTHRGVEASSSVIHRALNEGGLTKKTITSIPLARDDALRNAGLPRDLVDWLTPTFPTASTVDPPDIVAVGFQELLPLHLGFTGRSRHVVDSRNRLILKEVQAHGGGEYSLVARSVNVGVALLVYARDAGIGRRITDVQTSWTGCGPLWMGNKGAVAVRFRVEAEEDGAADEVFTFVSVHLTAHTHNLAQRLHDYIHIVRTLLFPAFASKPRPGPDTIYDSTHLFLFGDLNFRLVRQEGLSYTDIQEKAASAEGRRELAALDELTVEMQNGTVCNGLHEGDFSAFKPTYKYLLSSETDYNPKRAPAWTDRILFATASDPSTSRTSNIRPVIYTSVPSYITSDHKPVVAILDVPSPLPAPGAAFPVLAAPPSYLQPASLPNLSRYTGKVPRVRSIMTGTSKPLIAIVGTTGTGKSQLGIELALALQRQSLSPSGLDLGRWKGGKVINADAMQVYRGLDIVTNKVTEEETQGVEHLLMDFKDPTEEYFVSQWVKDAMKEIDLCHEQDQLPIVVGGTTYWIQHLIFPNRLVSLNEDDCSPTGPEKEGDELPLSSAIAEALANLPEDLKQLYANLPDRKHSDACSENTAFALHTLLCKLDPPMGERWHWKDTRKVLRSLEIIKESGQRTSDINSSQDESFGIARYPTLIYWLYTKPELLNPRLDARVDKMAQRGMLEEIMGMRTAVVGSSERCNPAMEIDYTRGIFQTIGFKEFHDYLSAPNPSPELLSQSREQMKHGTRKYAQRQVRWIQNKLIPAVRSQGSHTTRASLALLDATDLGFWDSDVRDTGLKILSDFLGERTQEDLIMPSQVAQGLLAGNRVVTSASKGQNGKHILALRLIEAALEGSVELQSNLLREKKSKGCERKGEVPDPCLPKRMPTTSTSMYFLPAYTSICLLETGGGFLVEHLAGFVSAITAEAGVLHHADTHIGQLFSSYQEARQALIAEDRSLRLDSQTQHLNALGDSETLQKVDGIIRNIRTREAQSVWAQETERIPHIFPGMEFLTAKETIQGTELFKWVRKLPKGALLHVHMDATCDAEFLLRVALEERQMHVRVSARITAQTIASTGPEFHAMPVDFKAAPYQSITSPGYEANAWINMKQARQNFSTELGGPEGFDNWVLAAMRLDPEEAYVKYNTSKKVFVFIWTKFASTFLVARGLLEFEPVLRKYVREFLLTSIEDGISYVEMRANFFDKTITRSDGAGDFSTIEKVRLISEVIAEVKEEMISQGRGDEFVGAKIIYITIRFMSPEELQWYLDDCFKMKQELPDLVAGFDLVGQEDTGVPLLDYLPKLLAFQERCKEAGISIPFIFHAGETLGDGDRVDDNLYDAILLGTKRIGHGFSLVKHPHLMKLCRERKIAIEVCPISNEILRLTSSMPAHPLPVMLNHGLTVALSSDDPSVFGNLGLSYDYFQVLVSSEISGLLTLGVLARESLMISELGPEEKKQAVAKWDRRWRAFVQDIIQGHD
ncbi:hypothetical protein FRB90_000468 [Tulasnella sp. 427]|nr:hypothetical protein FRB90_000468 [Tulasnella sp. 427]